MIKYRDETVDVTVAKDAVVSASFRAENWVSFLGAYFPAMDNGAIGLQASSDNSNFYTVLDPTDGAAVVLCASGSDPGMVDFSDFVRFIPDGYYLRFTCAAQTGAKTIKVFRRG